MRLLFQSSLKRGCSFRRVKDYKDIRKNMDELMSADGNKTIEYIFTKPKWSRFLSFLLKDSQSTGNPYGHSAIRYIDPNTGKDVVMNVCGVKGKTLINFIQAEEYLFTDIFHEGNEQGGIFNRSFVGVRIENVPVEKIKRLDEYYKQLAKDHIEGRIQFFILPLSFLNPIRKLFGFPLVGNCSVWTSKGLEEIGYLPRSYSWPLLLFFEILRAGKSTLFQNLNVVSYLSLHYPKEPRGSLIYPFYWLRKGYSKIWNLDELSNLVVVLTSSKKIYGEKAFLNLEKENHAEEAEISEKNNEVENRIEHQACFHEQKHIKEKYQDMMEKLKSIFNM